MDVLLADPVVFAHCQICQLMLGSALAGHNIAALNVSTGSSALMELNPGLCRCQRLSPSPFLYGTYQNRAIGYRISCLSVYSPFGNKSYWENRPP